MRICTYTCYIYILYRYRYILYIYYIYIYIANLEEMLVLRAEWPGSNHWHCQTLRLTAGNHCLVGAGRTFHPTTSLRVLCRRVWRRRWDRCDLCDVVICYDTSTHLCVYFAAVFGAAGWRGRVFLFPGGCYGHAGRPAGTGTKTKGTTTKRKNKRSSVWPLNGAPRPPPPPPSTSLTHLRWGPKKAERMGCHCFQRLNDP